MRPDIRLRPTLTLMCLLICAFVVVYIAADASADPSDRSHIDDVAEADPAPAPIATDPATVNADPGSVNAPPAGVNTAPSEAAPTPDQRAEDLTESLSHRLTVWTRPDGSPVHVAHCRRVHDGCEPRLEAFAGELVDAAAEHELDPYLLAAVAVRESGLDPTAVGPAGEGGIVQLHPRGVGADVRYVRDDRFRARCARDPGACQGEVLEVGARHLAEAIEGCGSVAEALGAYNTGRCTETVYSRRVLAERRRLLR